MSHTKIAISLIASTVVMNVSVPAQSPQIQLTTPSKARVVISWTNNPAGMLIESATSLSLKNWQSFSGTPDSFDSKNFLTPDVSVDRERYFRLHSLQPGVSPPALSVESFQRLLTWSSSFPNFIVEYNDELGQSEGWRLYPYPPIAEGNRLSVGFNIVGNARLFRLRGIPQDPSKIASPIDQTVATSIYDSTAFLYSGTNAIQYGVTNGTISLLRAAVIRGRVLRRSGSALPGVKISVLQHPEFGYTFTRLDGGFDLAVNGGGLLVVKYELNGFCPSQRQVNVPWNDFRTIPDVVLVQADPVVTPISFGSNAPQQVARGSVQIDADGGRQATVIFPAGTCANIVLANGQTQACSGLSVRATEFTVGTNGLAAMPAELPPSSAYTYCVDLSGDEAVAAGATSVQFNQPVCFYVENFLGFDVGTIVPVGFYDLQQGQWIASTNGQVIKILSISGGMANVDTDGDGLVDTGANLSPPLTTAERQRLATLYSANQSVWRICVTHFTEIDGNMGLSAPGDATFPNQSKPMKPNLPHPALQCGSIIEAQNQILRERIPITGTPFTLGYRSDRVPGRVVNYTVTIPISGTNVTASVSGVELELSIAGRTFIRNFAPLPGQQYTFTWDGKDFYGRAVNGIQPLNVRIGYTYPAVTYAVFTSGGGGGGGGGGGSFGKYGGSVSSVLLRGGTGDPRGIFTFWESYSVPLGVFTALPAGLGGWMLDEHQGYDPAGKDIYEGNEQVRFADSSLLSIVTTLGGGGSLPFTNGIVATNVSFSDLHCLAAGADGSIFVGDSGNSRVWRIATNGLLSVVAGNGQAGAAGDNGPATSATLNSVDGLAVAPNGAVYIATSDANGTNSRIRCVAPDGIIRTIAGQTNRAFTGDGGPASQALLNRPHGISVAPDGTIFFADTGNNRIRRISTDGIITTAVGGGNSDPSNSIFATSVKLNGPTGVAVGPDGTLYIADRENHRVEKVGVDGGFFVMCGQNTAITSGDGGPASLALAQSPEQVAVSSDGSVYFSDNNGDRVRGIGPDGIINTVAGNGGQSPLGEGGPALQAGVHTPSGVAVGADGNLYFALTLGHLVRKVSRALPGVSFEDHVIASEDGSEVYIFDAKGRHLRTHNALTGTIRYQFAYDSAGRLSTVTDGDNNVTTVEHDPSGNPTAIVGPYGHRTLLSVDANGYLASISNPAGETMHMAYTAAGLLMGITDPRTNTTSFGYDAVGRLAREDDPAGGFKILSGSETITSTTNTYTVSIGTALGRTNTYQVINLPTGARRRISTTPAGLQTVTAEDPDGTSTSTIANGSWDMLTEASEPRFQMLVPTIRRSQSVTPGGLTNFLTQTRTVALSNAGNLLSLSGQTDALSVNGQTYNIIYTAPTRQMTVSSPMLRRATNTYDNQERPLKVELPGLASIAASYDARGRVTNIFGTAANVTRSLSYAYATNGYLTSIADSAGRSFDFAYDAAGRVVTNTLPENRTIVFAYDSDGNVARITPPGRPEHSFTYSATGLPTMYSPPSAFPGTNSTIYGYNFDQELTLIQRPDGKTIGFDYQGAGVCNCDRLSSISIARGTFAYVFDPITGNIISNTAPGGVNLGWTYDGSLITASIWSGPISGAVQYTYDNEFRVVTNRVNSITPIGFQYDADSYIVAAGSMSLTNDPQNGLLQGTSLGLVKDSWRYNAFGEPTNYVVSVNSTQVFALTYSRDNLGRILQKTEVIRNMTNTYAYTYDAAGRLTNAMRNGVNIGSYIYDGNGNRMSTAYPSYSVANNHDAQDRLLSPSLSTPPSSIAYSYTANGELQSKVSPGQTTTYDYDELGNLLQVVLPTGKQVQYITDGQCRRVGKVVNGSQIQGFLYEDWLRPAAELDASGNVVSRFVYASSLNVPEYMIRGGVQYRMITDHLGSPRLVVNTLTGEIAQELNYDEWGNVLLDTSPGFQPFGFSGGIYDSDTGLVRFGWRDYEAATGRWTAKDPLLFGGASMNLYAYAFDDPVNQHDPTGLYACLQVQGNKIRILLPIQYHGPGATKRIINIFNNGIKRAWTGKFGKYQVNVDIVQGTGENQIDVPNQRGRSFVNSNGPGGTLDPMKKNTGTWYRYDSDLGWTAAHEAGHLLGLDDRYKDTGPHSSIIERGYRGHIMGDYFGKVTAKELKELLDKNKCRYGCP